MSAFGTYPKFRFERIAVIHHKEPLENECLY